MIFLENNIILGFLLKLFLKTFYFFFKLLPSKNKVVLISREQNTPPIDFLLLEEEIISRNKNIEIVMLCKTIDKSLKSFVFYCFYLLKCTYHLATARACVVDTYCIPVSVLKHKKSLKVIQVWHALGALKKFGYQSLGKAEGRSRETAERMCMHKNYDLVCCASNATAKIYAEAFNVERSVIDIVGMPRIDEILKPEPRLKDEFLKQYPEHSGKKIILYVPTFRKGERVNYKPLKCNLSDGYSLIVKPHILSESEIERDCLSKGFSTNQLLKISDYIITDYSAVSFEASLLNKPLYFYVYDLDEYKHNRGLNIDLTDEMKNATFFDAKKLLNNIESGSYDFDGLKHFRDKYVETADRENSKRIVNYILKYMSL